MQQWTKKINLSMEKGKTACKSQYRRSMWTGRTSQSSWLLGLAAAVSSWKFSKVDIMSWTCRFSSLISCHNWDTERHEKIADTLPFPSVWPDLPAATSAENCCPAPCKHTSWFVPAIRDRGHWPSCSFPVRRTRGPASRSRWSLVNSWRCENTGCK